jgi:hypothetical protein
MVVLIPVPVLDPPPGNWVIVQVPVAGNPFNTMVPVEITQVGWVTVPIEGAAGAGGCGWITTSAEEGEVQPASLVTLKV